jgi:hypothetical protein
MDEGRYAEAAAAYREVLTEGPAILGGGHAMFPAARASLARALARVLSPAKVTLVERSAGSDRVIRVLLGSSSTSGGTSTFADEPVQLAARQDWTAWRTLDAKTPLRLEAPTIWTSGLSYDQFRAYGLRTTTGNRVAAAVVTGTCGSGYWGIQAMRWTDPPAVADPDSTVSLDGRSYLLFYQNGRLHMVAWRENGALYWVVNTLANDLSNQLMLSLARSCEPVGG